MNVFKGIEVGTLAWDGNAPAEVTKNKDGELDFELATLEDGPKPLPPGKVEAVYKVAEDWNLTEDNLDDVAAALAETMQNHFLAPLQFVRILELRNNKEYRLAVMGEGTIDGETIANTVSMVKGLLTGYISYGE